MLQNFNLLQQIGYLEQRVLESDGVQGFVAKFDEHGHGIQKKSRGRPKRVEVQYEELVDPEAIGDDHLIFPDKHGLTQEQLKQAETAENAGFATIQDATALGG